MKFLKKFDSINENSKNEPIPELTQKLKLGVVLLGAPGSGKSTFIKKFISHRNPNLKSFSTDDISFQLTKDPNQYHPRASELNIIRLRAFINSGNSFIYDTTGTHSQQVFEVCQLAKDKGYKIIFIHMITDQSTAKKQNQQRDRKVDLEYLDFSYKEQFKRMSEYSTHIQPENYYVIFNINDKYRFYKYRNGHLLKRKVNQYVSVRKMIKESWVEKKKKLLDGVFDSGGIVKTKPLPSWVKDLKRPTEPDVDLSQIPIFINKMGEMIEKKWEIFDVDDKEISKLSKNVLGNIPLKNYYSTDEATSHTELLIVKIFNLGYSVGYFDSDTNKRSHTDFDFEEFVGSLHDILRFDQNDNKEKLVWTGPDLTSSKLLSCGPNIAYQIKNIKSESRRYNDPELGELKVIFGTVYQYGFNYGYEIGYVETRLRGDELRDQYHNLIVKKNRTKSDEVKMKEIQKELWGD